MTSMLLILMIIMTLLNGYFVGFWWKKKRMFSAILSLIAVLIGIYTIFSLVNKLQIN